MLQRALILVPHLAWGASLVKWNESQACIWEGVEEEGSLVSLRENHCCLWAAGSLRRTERANDIFPSTESPLLLVATLCAMLTRFGRRPLLDDNALLCCFEG